MIPGTYLQLSCVLATLAASSLFLARGTGDLIAAHVIDDEAMRMAPSIAGADALEPPPGSRAPDPRAILARNIFDAQTGPLWPPPEDEPVLEEELPEEPETEIDLRCDTEMRIAATFFNDRRPERSWVVLRGPNIGPGRPYGPGMAVGEHTVGVIEPNAVRLDGAGASCWLGMFNDRSREKVALETRSSRISKAKAKAKARAKARAKAKAKAKKKRAKRRRRTSRAKPAFSRSELQAGIRKVDSTRYVLEGELFDKAMARMTDIAKATRLVPVRSQHEVVGMRLVRLPKHGLLAHVGLERGDIVRRINGFAVGEPDDMLNAYARLGDANRLTVAVKRGGRFVNLEYRVQ